MNTVIWPARSHARCVIRPAGDGLIFLDPIAPSAQPYAVLFLFFFVPGERYDHVPSKTSIKSFSNGAPPRLITVFRTDTPYTNAKEVIVTGSFD
jgi:hypothetical protein